MRGLTSKKGNKKEKTKHWFSACLIDEEHLPHTFFDFLNQYAYTVQEGVKMLVKGDKNECGSMSNASTLVHFTHSNPEITQNYHQSTFENAIRQYD